VAEAARVAVGAGGSVGAGAEVFVGKVSGSVGVLKGIDCVICACTVRAAAVSTALGPSVAGAFDGRLHADSIKMITTKTERLRATLSIGFSSLLAK
jgi:hypothetical protein